MVDGSPWRLSFFNQFDMMVEIASMGRKLVDVLEYIRIFLEDVA